MKNNITCKNCGAETPFYLLTCKSCNAYIRDKVSNINLWEIIWKLIETPVEAFRLIIFAEHKNFTSTLLIFTSVKFALLATILANFTRASSLGFDSDFLFLSYAASLIAVPLLSVISALLNKTFGLNSGIKDSLAINIYALFPLAVALIVFAPIEYALFGSHWFTFNPAPYQIKPTISYFFYGLEGAMILWSLFLFIAGNYAQSKNILFAILTGATTFVLYFSVLSLFL